MYQDIYKDRWNDASSGFRHRNKFNTRMYISNFLNSLNSDNSKIRWKASKGDVNFFESCAYELNSLNVKTVLDICCGMGEFVNICTKKYNMHAYGIDPIVDCLEPYGIDPETYKSFTENDNLYTGSIESILATHSLLNNFKFDCISIQNTLHGKQWKTSEFNNIFKFLKKYSKYIVISDPANIPDFLCLSGIKCLHKFHGSHGRNSVIHKIYKIE